MVRNTLSLEELTEKIKSNFKTHLSWVDGHLLWTGAKIGEYGSFNIKGKTHSAHRVALVILTGIDPPEMDASHTCENKLCTIHVEWQLYSINRGESERNKTHCPQGHEYNSENTYSYTTSKGRQHRDCKKCKKKKVLDFYYSNQAFILLKRQMKKLSA